MKIFIIEDEHAMADCLMLAAHSVIPTCEIQTFSDAISATDALSDGLPDLIFLDVLLGGPDGFTFLNEMISYDDTARIPIVLVTSLNFPVSDLSHYGVVALLHKETMTPQDVQKVVKRYV